METTEKKEKMSPIQVEVFIAGLLVIVLLVLYVIKTTQEITIGNNRNTTTVTCCQQSDDFLVNIWENIDKYSVSATAHLKVKGSDTVVNGIQLCKVVTRIPWAMDTLYTYSAYMMDSSSVYGRALIIPGQKGFFFREKTDLWGLVIAILANDKPMKSLPHKK